MPQSSKKKILGEALSELVTTLRSGSATPQVRVGLMAYGSELGQDELLDGARLAMQRDPRVKVIAIGPMNAAYSDLEWIETPACEADISVAMEKALAEGSISSAVALHYPFPMGVTTIGRVVTPSKGRAMFIASTTGTSATNRVEAIVRNAIYGVAGAKACGIASPKVGVMNVDGAQTAVRLLNKLKDNGYALAFGESQRSDGGAILRGNDALMGSVDVCVTDTLTGNIMMKFFAAWNSGGSYEASGWGYGPSVGEGWKKLVSIISRASGAPVVAGALCYTAETVRGSLVHLVASELKAAKAAGLDALLADLQQAPSAAKSEVAAPPAEPTGEEIHGIDVLSIDDATHALWEENIYAESAMGCTGPVVKVPERHLESAKKILTSKGFI